jgi:chromate transporter
VKEYLELAWTFFRMGCMTFGGGYAMVPVLERMVIPKGWITMDEVMDYYTIGQVTPGIIAVNVSTFVGYKLKGAAGGILATLSFILPSMLIITGVALFLRSFAHIPLIRHAFGGIRVAVGALILDTVIKLCRGFFKDVRALCIFGIALGLSAVFSVSPALLVMAAGAAGFLLYRKRG